MHRYIVIRSTILPLLPLLVAGACAPPDAAVGERRSAAAYGGKADLADGSSANPDALADGGVDAAVDDLDAASDASATDAAAADAAADAAATASPYPAAPYGTRVGRTLADHTFVRADNTNLSFAAVRSDPTVKAILWVQSAEWCGSCIDQVSSLNALHDAYGDEGLYVMESMIQDRYYDTPDASTARRWMRHGTRFAVVSDPHTAMFPEATPTNYIIDAETMVLRRVIEGDDPAVETAVRAALDASTR